LGNWNYSLAVGLEWIKGFRNTDQGIGTGGDQLAPLVGLALTKKPGWVFIPLLQHFLSYRGEDINTTATQLIAIQSLENAKWLKYDIIVRSTGNTKMQSRPRLRFNSARCTTNNLVIMPI